MDVDIESDMGHFGWEELISGTVIPFIVRENKKYCSLDIFTKHLVRDIHANLKDDDLKKFDDLQTYALTQIESYLLNEINHLHCDSLYRHNFKIGDFLVELNDINLMSQFFHDCRQKLTYGDEYDLRICGILRIRRNSDSRDFLVPYVRIDDAPYVLINKCKFYKTPPKKCVKLKGINLQYMKFVCKVLHMKIDDIGHCMPFNEIEKGFGPGRIDAREYWPNRNLSEQFYTPMMVSFADMCTQDVNISTQRQHEIASDCDVNPPVQPIAPTTDQLVPTQQMADSDDQPTILTTITTANATAANGKTTLEETESQESSLKTSQSAVGASEAAIAIDENANVPLTSSYTGSKKRKRPKGSMQKTPVS